MAEGESDDQLVKRFLAGESDAFAELMGRHEDRVFGLASRLMGNRQDALDATQEVFLQLLRKLDRYDSHAAFSTWLYRVATNVCYDLLRRRRRQPVLSPDPVDSSRRFRSLAEYLVSLARLRSFAPTLVYGGHGEPVTDFEELFTRYLRAIRERQAEVIGLVPKTGASAWDVAQEMFPGAEDVHRFLSVSEAVAHLDLAHAENKLALELSDGREVYRKLTAN